jgi:hypothetical protein
MTNPLRPSDPPLFDTVEALVLDLLEWVGPNPRPYCDVIEAWRTSCPRLPVWEDANDRGFISRSSPAGTRHARLRDRHRSRTPAQTPRTVATLTAPGREVGVAPEMRVAPAEQVSRDRSLSFQRDRPGRCRFTPWGRHVGGSVRGLWRVRAENAIRA